MIAIIVIAALAGIVWATVYLKHGSLLAGCLVFLVFGYCLGHDLAGFKIGPLPLTLDRLLLGGLIVAFIIKWRLGHSERNPATWIEMAMVALAGVLVLSTFTHNWQLDLTKRVSPIWLLVAGYLMPIAVYLIARQAPMSRKSIGMVHGFLALFGLYLAVTAIAEVTQQWWLIPHQYMSDPDVGIHFGRARGPALQAQSLGFYLVVCLFATWFWSKRFGRAGQLALLLVCGVILVGIGLTYTRCVWMGLALGGLLILGLSLRGYWRPLVLGSIVTAGLAVAVLFWDNIVSIKRDSGAAASRSSVRQRSSFAYVSWLMLQDRPILGAGFGQFPVAVRPYLSDRSTSIPLENIRDYPHHNTFLSLLTETGLLGMGLFVAVLIGWGRDAWRMWRSDSAPDWVRNQGLAMLGVLAAYLCLATFFDTAYSPHDHWLVFMLAGVTAGLRPWIATAKSPACATEALPTRSLPAGTSLQPNTAT